MVNAVFKTLPRAKKISDKLLAAGFDDVELLEHMTRDDLHTADIRDGEDVRLLLLAGHELATVRGLGEGVGADLAERDDLRLTPLLSLSSVGGCGRAATICCWRLRTPRLFA